MSATWRGHLYAPWFPLDWGCFLARSRGPDISPVEKWQRQRLSSKQMHGFHWKSFWLCSFARSLPQWTLSKAKGHGSPPPLVFFLFREAGGWRQEIMCKEPLGDSSPLHHPCHRRGVKTQPPLPWHVPQPPDCWDPVHQWNIRAADLNATSPSADHRWLRGRQGWGAAGCVGLSVSWSGGGVEAGESSPCELLPHPPLSKS